MLAKSVSPPKKSKPLNLHPCQKELQQELAKEYIALNNESKEIFFLLVKYIDNKELQKLPNFLLLQDNVCTTISAQEVFDEVACYLVKTNNLVNLKYLIENRGFNLTAARGEGNTTLLHFACEYNHNDIIIYLLQQNFNVNVKTSDGLTPLHISAIKRNVTIIPKILQAKANTKILYKGCNHIQLKNENLYALNTEVLSIDTVEENTALYIKALFSNKFDPSPFKVYIEFLKNVTLSTKIQHHFCLAFLFSINHLTVETIINFFTTYVETEKVSIDRFIVALQVLTEFYIRKGNFSYANVIEELNKLQLDLLEKINTQLPYDAFKWYGNISCWYNKIYLPEKGIDTAKKALMILPDVPGNEINRSYIFYNLGLCQQELFNEVESFKSFENAFTLNSHDNEILLDYFRALHKSGNYEKAKDACSTSNCQKDTELLTLFAKLGSSELSGPEVSGALEQYSSRQGSNESLLIDLQCECHLASGNFEKAFATAQTSFLLTEQLYKKTNNILIANHISKFLRVCLLAKKHQEAFDILRECQANYPQEYIRSIPLKTMRFIFYVKTGELQAAEQLLNELSKTTIFLDFLCNMWISLALHQKELSKMLNNLEIALKISPDSEIAHSYIKLALLLIEHNNSQKTDNPLETSSNPVEMANIAISGMENTTTPVEKINSMAVDITTQQDLDQSGSIEETADFAGNDLEDHDPENDYENWEPQQIHKFFQEQKKMALSILESALLTVPKSKGLWKVGETIYSEEDSDVFSLKSPLYPDHYAVIDRSLNVDKKYYEILEKGLCSKAKKQDGLKILCNTLAELKKVGENNRFYTLRIYQNGKKCLFVLNKLGNHLTLKRELRARTNFEVLDVSSIPEMSTNSEEKKQELPPDKANDNHQPIQASAGTSFLSPVLTPKPKKVLNQDIENEDLKKESKPSSLYFK